MRLRVICGQAQLGDVEHLGAGLVPGQGGPEDPCITSSRFSLDLHVHEVDHDDAADVAQAELTRDLLGGLEVVAEDGLLEATTSRRSCPVLTSMTVRASV